MNSAYTHNPFMRVPLTSILVFAVFVTIGIVQRRRREIHMPLMLFATLAVLGAPTLRTDFWGMTLVVQTSGADQPAVTLGNVDGEIASLLHSDPPRQAEVQALRGKCE